ncbi:hypothetical protein EDB84DRAFT_1676627 [Lactarius hengduanensis]|nr:hypothetical protein EDB84DRAFT_1676627 [Lactarius hengduanensis]
MGKVWCLLIDHELKPTFGEPLSEWSELNDTIHDLKIKIKKGASYGDLVHITANRMQIWKCKSLKLSANDPFRRTRKLLKNIKFSYDENSNVQHLAPAQVVMDLGPADDELLLVLVPDIGTIISGCLGDRWIAQFRGSYSYFPPFVPVVLVINFPLPEPSPGGQGFFLLE